MTLGFRPAYIIIELVHEGVNIQLAIKEMLEFDYIYLTQRGYNHIFEHQYENTQKNVS